MKHPSYIEKIAISKPLIHCITNMITANFQANALLAIGASPIMVDEPESAADVTKKAQALVINIGSPLSAEKRKAIHASLTIANQMQIPTIIDPVGSASIDFRYHFVNELLETYHFNAICGNYSEIIRLTGLDCPSAKGVDSIQKVPNIAQSCSDVARKFQTIVVATGAIDYISDGIHMECNQINNPELQMITGTGCIATTLIGAFISQKADSTFNSARKAVTYYNDCCHTAIQNASLPGSLQIEILNQLFIQRQDESMKEGSI